MKNILKSIAFFLLSVLVLSSCNEEVKTGKSPEKIAETIAIIEEETLADTTPSDSVVVEEPEVVLPTIPPPPPMPCPEPEPNPWPNPLPPDPLPEPPPPPMPGPDPVVDFAEVEAEFPGGPEEMMKFVRSNIEYPIVAMENGYEGRVFVEFIVEKDGSLSNIKVLRGISPEIDKEAKRVVGIMPKWTPSESRGRKVRSRFRLPINFTLD